MIPSGDGTPRLAHGNRRIPGAGNQSAQQTPAFPAPYFLRWSLTAVGVGERRRGTVGHDRRGKPLHSAAETAALVPAVPTTCPSPWVRSAELLSLLRSTKRHEEAYRPVIKAELRRASKSCSAARVAVTDNPRPQLPAVAAAAVAGGWLSRPASCFPPRCFSRGWSWRRRCAPPPVLRP